MNEILARSLEKIKEPKVSEIGGKGYSLAVLINSGFNVPKGFIITSEAFFEFLKYNKLPRTIQKLASEINKDNFRDKGKEIRNVILKGEIPDRVTTEIKKHLAELNIKAVAARSSSANEDSLKASFAGLFDTFINVNSEYNLVLSYVKRCWASLFNGRAIIYRLEKKMPHLEGMAVIIQEVIPAEVSGTVFTVHPDKKNEGVMVIECSWGLGEAIVSGITTPDHYIVDKTNLKIVKKTLGRKRVMVEVSNGGTRKIHTPDEKASKFCLTDQKVESVTKICLNIEKIFGFPQDIEWCIQKNKMWVLQSRYITK